MDRILTLLFLACSESKDPEYGVKKVDYLRLFMKEKGAIPTQITYGSIINAYGRLGAIYKAFDTADEMIANGLKPKKFIFSKLFVTCNEQKIGGFQQCLKVSLVQDVQETT
jgi:pentatricopeptide repeat protein